MKITQAQVRVIRSMLRNKAEVAVKLAVETARQNHEANRKAIDAACAKVLKKYEKQLVKSLRPNVDNIIRGFSTPCCIEYNNDVVETIRNECKAAIDGLKLKGTDSIERVYFASLNMLYDYGRNEDNRALEVPANEVEKWKDLARSIDESFMTGDANKLAWIIGNFK